MASGNTIIMSERAQYPEYLMQVFESTAPRRVLHATHSRGRQLADRGLGRSGPCDVYNTRHSNRVSVEATPETRAAGSGCSSA